MKNLPISELLKQKRIKKNVSVETIFKEAHVPSKFVYMIENGEWEKFPSEVHLKGFLRLYAEYMGIEPSMVEQCIRDIYGRNSQGKLQDDFFCWKSLHKPLKTARMFSLILLFAVGLIILCLFIISRLPE